MKNEKFCFSKGTGLIALVGILLVGFVLFTQVVQNQQTSTNSRAGLNCTQVKDVINSIVNTTTGYSYVFTGISNGTGGCATKGKICLTPVVNEKCNTQAAGNAAIWAAICKQKVTNQTDTSGKMIAFKDANGMCMVYTGGYDQRDGRCLVRGAKSTDITNECTGNVASDVNNCAGIAKDAEHYDSAKGKYIAYKLNGVCVVNTGTYALDGRCKTRNANSLDIITACQAAGSDPNGCAAKVGTLDPVSGHYFNGRFNPNTGICLLD